MLVRLDHNLYYINNASRRYYAVVVTTTNCFPSARQYSSFCPQFLGDLSEEDPPVPIPNTVVKLLSPDGTARASVWESRTSPGLI